MTTPMQRTRTSGPPGRALAAVVLCLTATIAVVRPATAQGMVDADDVVATAIGGPTLAYVTNDETTLVVRDLATGDERTIAESAFGIQDPSVSDDGNRVAWSAREDERIADSSRLFSGQDVFWHDLDTGETGWVPAPDTPTRDPALSGNGRYLAVEIGNDGRIARHDIATGETTQVSVNSDGQPADGLAVDPSISDDGRYVAFVSTASNLAPVDTRVFEGFVHDTVTGSTTLVSTTASGEPSRANARDLRISGDGTRVVFSSESSGLSGLGLRLFTYVTTLADGSVRGLGEFGHTVHDTSDDGRYVLISEWGFEPVPGLDEDGADDLFLYDTATDQLALVTGDEQPGACEDSDRNPPFPICPLAGEASLGDDLTVHYVGNDGTGSDLYRRTLRDEDFAPSLAPPPTGPTPPPTGPAPTDARPSTPTDPAASSGYWMLDQDGRVYPFGRAEHLGEPLAELAATSRRAVQVVSRSDGTGYWVLDSSGGVHAAGSAVDHGDLDTRSVELLPGERPATLSTTPDGTGYWIFTDRGRAIAFGSAPDLPDLVETGVAPRLQGPIVDSIATPSGLGYYMIGTDGGVFAFGDAEFAGSVPGALPGVRLNAPVNGIVADPDDDGYWLVASDGGVFAFDADFVGSVPGALGPGVSLNEPVNGMVPFGDGYLMVASDGGIFAFSDEPFYGSLGGETIPAPVVAVTAFALP
ncbi:MAG: hypothetical protein AAGA17_01945 [Actinomycetota bacterium]